MEASEKTPCRQTEPRPTGESTTKKSLFTPCRRVGLKRKSSGAPSTPGVTPNSCFKNHRLSFETPKRETIVSESSPIENTLDNQKVTLVENLVPAPVCKTRLEPHSSKNDSNIIAKASNTPNKVPTLHKSTSSPHTDEASYSKNCEHPSEEMLQSIRKRVKEKETQLEELRSSHESSKKKVNDTDRLQQRTEVWRTGCQKALIQLLDKTQSLGHQLSMTEMITQLSIPFDLIRYDDEVEDFKEP